MPVPAGRGGGGRRLRVASDPEHPEGFKTVALIDCPECGRQVSTLAVACPHCGFPLSREAAELQAARREPGPSRWTDPGFWIIVIGLVVVIVMTILILREGWQPTDTTVPVSPTRAEAAVRGGCPATLGPGTVAVGVCVR